MSIRNRPEWLPKGIVQRRGWWCYRPYLGRDNGKTLYGCEVRVTKVTATPQQFFRIFESITCEAPPLTLSWLLREYSKSAAFKSLSRQYRNDCERFKTQLCDLPIKTTSGKRTIFGKMSLQNITPPKIQRYIDSDPRPVVNRRVQYLRAAWNWARLRYEGLPENPCNGVKEAPEEGSNRYIEDWEYWLVYLCAARRKVPIFAPAMELSYLCRARRGEVFKYTKADFRENGLYLARSKQSNSEITGWSNRLIAALEFCDSIHPNPPEHARECPLLHTKAGIKYTKNTLDTAWQRVINSAKEQGAELPEELVEEARKSGAKVIGSRVFLLDHFTFHDIKGKGCTDHEAQNAGQHKSKKMEALYQKRPNVVKATR